MADTLDAVNASFDDCEEVDDDIDVEADKPEQDKAEPMIDLDAAMVAKDLGEKAACDATKAYEVDKTAKDEVKDVTEVTAGAETADGAGKAEDANEKVVSIEQYRAG